MPLPGIHLYKECFSALAAYGINVAYSEQLETVAVACLKTPDLAGAVQNWSSLLTADPQFQAAYGAVNR